MQEAKIESWENSLWIVLSAFFEYGEISEQLIFQKNAKKDDATESLIFLLIFFDIYLLMDRYVLVILMMQV